MVVRIAIGEREREREREREPAEEAGGQEAPHPLGCFSSHTTFGGRDGGSWLFVVELVGESYGVSYIQTREQLPVLVHSIQTTES
jgi:hypothetical protein